MDVVVLLAVVSFSLMGSGLGCLSGITPGVHVNTLALLLTSSSSVLLPAIASAATLLGTDADLAPLLLVTVIVSAAVAHSILDFLPSIFLGAPDEDAVLSVLPGHRLLLAGRGLDAVACAAGGGLVGASVGVTLCLPLYLVLGPPLGLYPLLDQATPLVVAAAVAALVLSESGTRMTAEIRVRRAVRCPEVMSLVRHVPVDMLPVTMSGKVEHTFAKGTWLITPTGRWRLRGRGVPQGSVCVEGVWRVRRTSLRERSLAVSLLLVSGLLGLCCSKASLPLDGTFVGLGQSIMFPLLTGLFGMPALLSSIRARPVPPQEGPKAHIDPWSGIRGALSGALVGWFPGISSTTGVIIGTAFQRRDLDPMSSSCRFITMVSAVGTSSTVLGLLAMAVAFKGRSGAMMAAKEVIGAGNASLLALPSPWFPLLLVAVLASSLVSYFLCLRAGRWLAARASGADLGRSNKIIAILLVLLAAAFCGLPGLAVLLVAALLGSVPPKLGVSRVHLTGCLLLPTVLYLSGAEEAALALL